MLLALSQEMLNVDVESEKMAGSSDWSGRGSISRGSSNLSTSSGGRFDELKSTIQSLSGGVRSSNALANI